MQHASKQKSEAHAWGTKQITETTFERSQMLDLKKTSKEL